MEADIMDLPAQLASRVVFIWILLFCVSCTDKTVISKVNSSDPQLDLFKNIVVFKSLPFSGLVFEFYPKSSDTLWVKNYKDGLKSGVWRKYYSNGTLKEVRRFVKGSKEGDYLGYYSNGAKNFIFQFNKGEYNGTNKIWTKEGLLIEEGNFKSGYEFGVQKTWYLDGKIKSNYVIKNNRRYGLLGTKKCINVSKDLFKT